MKAQTLDTCQRWAEKLAARHPDDCNADELRALDAHLASCPDCADRRAEYAALSHRIQAAIVTEQAYYERLSAVIPPEFAPALIPVIPVSATQWRRGPWRVRPTLAQGLCFVLLILLLFSGAALIMHASTSNYAGGQPTISSISTTIVGSTKPTTIIASAYVVAGKPTLNVATINAILKERQSPLKGQGQFIYNLGLQYKVDPAFILALGSYASALGTIGEAVQTRSIGDLPCYTGVKCVGGYASYNTWGESVQALYSLINNYYIRERGLTTVDQIIAVYAPTTHTFDHIDQLAYITAVENEMDSWQALPTNKDTHS